MATPVKIRTALPSLEELGVSFGVSKARQKAIIALMERGMNADASLAPRKSGSSSSKIPGPVKVARGAKR